MKSNKKRSRKEKMDRNKEIINIARKIPPIVVVVAPLYKNRDKLIKGFKSALNKMM